jgi:hypothetical protein
MSRSYLCVPITGTSVLSLLEGFSEAIVLVGYRGLIVLMCLGVCLTVCKSTVLKASINTQTALAEECLPRSEGGAQGPGGHPAAKTGWRTCKICC